MNTARNIITSILIGVLLTGCPATLRNLGGGTAKENAVQALVSTTRSAVLIMTAAGIAYDAGAFGTPGSDRAETTWNRIAAESVRMGEALTAWSEAIKANRDASSFSSMVSQALAVIGALLPARKDAELRMSPDVTAANYAALSNPEQFRTHAFAGGIR